MQANTSSNIANTSINTSISSSAIPNTGNHPADSRRSSYSSPEPLSMASRTSSYASLSTTDGSLIHANGKIFFYIFMALIFFCQIENVKIQELKLKIQVGTRSEIIHTIWGPGPLRKQFDVAPYSLKPDELKMLQRLDHLNSVVNAKRLVTLSIE